MHRADVEHNRVSLIGLPIYMGSLIGENRIKIVDLALDLFSDRVCPISVKNVGAENSFDSRHFQKIHG